MSASLEKAKAAIKTQLLSSEFQDILIAVYEDEGDDEPGSDEFPKEVHTVLKWAPQQFPNAQMGPPRGRNESPEAIGYLDITYDFLLYWEVTHTEEERIDIMIQRLVRATQDFYKDRANLLVEAANCSIWTGDEDYSPLINQGDGKPFIQAASLNLFVRMSR